MAVSTKFCSVGVGQKYNLISIFYPSDFDFKLINPQAFLKNNFSLISVLCSFHIFYTCTANQKATGQMHEVPHPCDKHDPRLPSLDFRNSPRKAHFIANNIYISKKRTSHSDFLLRVYEHFNSKAVTYSARMRTFVQEEDKGLFWWGHFIPHEKPKCWTPAVEPFYCKSVAKLSPSFLDRHSPLWIMFSLALFHELLPICASLYTSQCVYFT